MEFKKHIEINRRYASFKNDLILLFPRYMMYLIFGDVVQRKNEVILSPP